MSDKRQQTKRRKKSHRRKTPRMRKTQRMRKTPRMRKTQKNAKFFKYIRKSLRAVKKLKSAISGARHDGISAFQVQNDYTPKVYELIKRNYDEKITHIKIGRTPIRKAIESALNLVSLGKWSRERRNFGYDNFYHLFLIVGTESGKRFIIEKNEVINVAHYTKEDPEDNMDVHVARPVRLGVLMKRAEESMDDYFLYDSFKNNCQVFVSNVLSGNNLLTPELQEYISQQLEEVLKTQPSYLSRIARNVTDIGGRVTRFLDGGTNRDEIKRNLEEQGELTDNAKNSVLDD